MITKEEVKHIAKLARLGVTSEEIEKFQKDLSNILDYFNSLKEVDVEGVEPLFHPTEHFFDGFGVMRKDVPEPKSPAEVKKLIEMAPNKKENYIKVKSVI